MGEMTRGRRSAHGRPPVRSRCAFAVCAALAASLAIAAPAYAACGPVALDPGHGGTESGASGFGLREEVLNWKVANYCKERLDQLGIPNFLTKQDYETLSRMERNRRAEARNARVLVSFHFNSGGGRGAEVLVTNTSTWNRFTNTESSAFGRDLLGKLSAAPFNLQNRLIKTNNWVGKTYPDGSVADSMGINYYPRLNGTTGLIIEHAFIDNLEDAAKLKSEGFLKQLGYADAEAIARHWPNSYVKPAASTVATNKNGWYSEGGSWYYYRNGKKATGWLDEGGQRYYLDPSTGARRTGWVTVGSQRYWFRTSAACGPVGSMGRGWLDDGGQRYFLDRSSGAMRTGWLDDGGRRYWLRTDAACGPVGSMGRGLLEQGGQTYLLDRTSGAMRTGWADDSGRRYWLRTDASCGPVGSMGKGWLEQGGQSFLLDRTTGAMRTGWADDGGQRYWLRTEATYGPVGSKGTGWLTTGGRRYWLRTDASCGPVGSMGRGWLEQGGRRYFLDRTTGAALTGTQTVEGRTYTFGADGALLSEGVKAGWQTEGGVRCYYENGRRATGWKDLDGQRYFFDRSTGAMRTGWVTDGGRRYWLRTDASCGPVGSMGRGWLDQGGRRYFLDRTTGAAATGVHVVDGRVCNFASDGALASDGPLNAWYDASWRPSSSTVSGSKVHYFDAGGREAYTRMTNTPVMGSPSMSKGAFVKAFAARIQASYPQAYRTDAKYGATTPEAFAQAAWDAATSEGVRPEVLAAQVGNETGWLRFGGIVNADQCNFGGLGALDGNANGNAATFATVQQGLLAQAQHLKAYSSKAALNRPCVDPRFNLVTRGIAPYLEDYGADGHGGLVWASNRLYGRDLLAAMRSITG